jgi:hypothetical protein
MEKDFPPISVKLSSTEFLMPSIAVKMPTNEVMPIAIMTAVSTERSILAAILRLPSLIFSAMVNLIWVKFQFLWQ